MSRLPTSEVWIAMEMGQRKVMGIQMQQVVKKSQLNVKEIGSGRGAGWVNFMAFSTPLEKRTFSLQGKIGFCGPRTT